MHHLSTTYAPSYAPGYAPLDFCLLVLFLNI